MINTDLVKEGIAIKINSEDEYLEMVNAMKWEVDKRPFPDNTYIWKDEKVFDGYNYSKTPPSDHKKIDFSDLKQIRLASILGVKEEEEFRFDNLHRTFKIINGNIYCLKSMFDVSVSDLLRMINNPDKIKPIKKYSLETIEDAKVVKRWGYDYVVNPSGEEYIEIHTDEYSNFIYGDLFTDIEYGVQVYLSDIIANE